jgi:hypothetical protein
MRRFFCLIQILFCFLAVHNAWTYHPEEWGERSKVVLPKVKQLVKANDTVSIANMLQQEMALPIGKRTPPIQNVLVWELGNIGDERALPVLYDILPDKAIKLEKLDREPEALAVVAIVRIQNRKKAKADQIAALLELWQQRSKLKHNLVWEPFDSEIAYAISKMDVKRVPKELLKWHPWPNIEILRQSISKMPKKKQIQTLIEFIEHTRENPRRAQYAIQILSEEGKPALEALLSTLKGEKYQHLPEKLSPGTPMYSPYTNLLEAIANIATIEDLPRIQALMSGSQGHLPYIEELVVERVKKGIVIPYEYSYLLVFH